jgi:hypothetical protein
MSDFALKDWLELIVVAIVSISVAWAITSIASSYFLSRQARKRFRKALARFRTLDWLSGIEREQQKRLTYTPPPTSEEDQPDTKGP